MSSRREPAREDRRGSPPRPCAAKSVLRDTRHARAPAAPLGATSWSSRAEVARVTERLLEPGDIRVEGEFVSRLVRSHELRAMSREPALSGHVLSNTYP